MGKRHFYTYILLCADNSLYTGWTLDLEKRLRAHNAGKASRYTRARLPVKLLTSWKFESKAEAMHYEWKIKKLSRKQKLKLIQTIQLCLHYCPILE